MPKVTGPAARIVGASKAMQGVEQGEQTIYRAPRYADSVFAAARTSSHLCCGKVCLSHRTLRDGPGSGGPAAGVARRSILLRRPETNGQASVPKPALRSISADFIPSWQVLHPSASVTARATASHAAELCTGLLCFANTALASPAFGVAPTVLSRAMFEQFSVRTDHECLISCEAKPQQSFILALN